MSNFKVLGFTLAILLVLAMCLQGNVSTISTPAIIIDIYIGPPIKVGDNDASPVFPLYDLTKDFIGTLVINSTSEHLATFFFAGGLYNSSELIVKGKGNEVADDCVAVLLLGDTGKIIKGTGAFSCASGSVDRTPGTGPTHLDEATITYETAC